MKLNLYNNYPNNIDFDYEKIVERIENGIDFNNEISLILVDFSGIQEINRDYRGLDRPTDVISFEEDDEEDDNYLGDIFVCIDKVYEQAKLYEHSTDREFAFLIIHGILHLLGYDHMKKDEEEIMFAKQEEILNKLGFTRGNSNETV